MDTSAGNARSVTLSRREKPILRVRREPRHPPARYRSSSLCGAARLADAELAAQFEELAVRGGERCLERGDLVAAAALLVGQLSGELADDDRLTATRWSAPWRGAEARSMRPISNAYTADEPVWSQSARQWRHVLPWSTCTSMILGGRPSTTSASMLLPSRGPLAGCWNTMYRR
jgi:hypothetical protein